ncbi:MAG TPA: hypothetical protein VFU82_03960 [Gammaproteobacteria bacterium]|nr:hypothetical protein [Gammaproteobacteria bacterium]
MPFSPSKKLNFFQRAKRRVSDFRKKHPYWFAFIVGAWVGVLAAAAFAIMIFVPPLTPAILTTAAVFASNISMSLAIPIAIGSVLIGGATMASIFAAARATFGRLFERNKPLLKKVETSTTPPLKEAEPPKQTPSSPSSSTSTLTDTDLFSAPTRALSDSKPVASAYVSFSPALFAQPPENDNRLAVKECIKAAEAAYHEKKREIVALFDETLAAINGIDHKNNFSLQTNINKAYEKIKNFKKQFTSGGLSHDVDLAFLKESFQELDKEKLKLINGTLAKVKAGIASPQYKDYEAYKQKIASVSIQANEAADKLRKDFRNQSLQGLAPAGVDSEVSSIKKDNKERIHRIQQDFFNAMQQSLQSSQPTMTPM